MQLYNAETHKFQFLTRTPSEAVAMRGEGQFPGFQIAKGPTATAPARAQTTPRLRPGVWIDHDAPESEWPLRSRAPDGPVVNVLGNESGTELNGVPYLNFTTYRYGNWRYDSKLQAPLGPGRRESLSEIEDGEGEVISERSIELYDQSFDEELGSYPFQGAPSNTLRVTSILTDPEEPAYIESTSNRQAIAHSPDAPAQSYRLETPASYSLSFEEQSAEVEQSLLECLLAQSGPADPCLDAGSHKSGQSEITREFDPYGNPTYERTEVPGSIEQEDAEPSVSEVERYFDNYTAIEDRFIAELRSETTTSSVNGESEFRRTDYSYDERHRQERMLSEPGRDQYTNETRLDRNAVGSVTKKWRTIGSQDEELLGEITYDPADLTTPVSATNALGQAPRLLPARSVACRFPRPTSPGAARSPTTTAFAAQLAPSPSSAISRPRQRHIRL